MNRGLHQLFLAAIISIASGNPVGAALHYVNIASANPAPPYTSWATAALTIQDAVDAAAEGGEVIVTNGVYQAGGRAVHGIITNRVAITKSLTVRSVNGPDVTVIKGYKLPGITNGDGAIRCIYLTNDAILIGFTLTNGATRTKYDPPSSPESSGGGVWCSSSTAILSNCILSGNSAFFSGGGAAYATLHNCTLVGNLVTGSFFNDEGIPFAGGGGAIGGTLNNCILKANTAAAGGGTFRSTLNNCTLWKNSAFLCGAGAVYSMLNTCTVMFNSAFQEGGGSIYSTLNGCALTGNSAALGGGAAFCTLRNCSLTHNSAYDGGGALESTLDNCIAYFNSSGRDGANYTSSTLNYCCTTPMPSNGLGNISLDPQLASTSHLSGNSPCIGAGSATNAFGTDIDGELWASPPSIGCDEYHLGAIAGPLSVDMDMNYTNIATGFTVDFIGLIDGRTAASVWDFGDGQTATNQPYISHAWNIPGNYQVILTAYNESYPQGVSNARTLQISDLVHHVAAANANPVPPYATWQTAARDIQSAVDVAIPGALVLVTNGAYATGGRVVNHAITNRVVINKPVIVRSVNGPASTTIEGYQVPGSTNGDSAIRCSYLVNGAVLSGFTLTRGATGIFAATENDESGGGAYCTGIGAIISNCVFRGNSARYGGGAFGGTLSNCRLIDNIAQRGGGAYGSRLNNCTLTGNTGYEIGGGALDSVLNNCTVTRNTSNEGGGALSCTLNNCIVYYNTATLSYPNYLHDISGYVNYSCTTPLPSGGSGNFTNVPVFVNQTGGDLRLQPTSPCINAGLNTYASSGLDLDGHARIVGGAVDIGAYEFETPSSFLSYAWLQRYRLPLDGSADYVDTDGDGLNNWQEWHADTDPTNRLSVLHLLTPYRTGVNWTLTWQSVASRTYILERSTNVTATVGFLPLAKGIAGHSGTTKFTETNTSDARTYFYRVRVEE